MKKIILCSIFIMLAMPMNLMADTIYLIDGSVKEGTIKRENTFSYTIRENGRDVRVFKDQVQSVERAETKEKSSELLEQLKEEGLVSQQELDNLEVLTDEKRALIVKMLEINGTRGLLESNKQDVLQKAPVEQFAQIDELINTDELLEEIIPIYGKHFSLANLKEIISFYEGEAGQKVISTTPDIMKEVVQASVQYFQKRLQNK